MTIEKVTDRQAFEEALREDQAAQDQAERRQAAEDQKRRERERELCEAEEARNTFGGCA